MFFPYSVSLGNQSWSAELSDVLQVFVSQIYSLYNIETLLSERQPILNDLFNKQTFNQEHY